MGQTFSKIASTSASNDPMRDVLGRNIGAQVVVGATVVGSVLFVLRLAKKAARRQTPHTLFDTGVKKKKKVAVNGAFFNSLKRLVKIMVPRVVCPETGYMLVVAVMMVLRTYCDVWMLNNGTAIERCIITRDPVGFRTHLFKLIIAMLPLSLVNNFLKYGLWELHLRFRSRLTKHLYGEYLRKYTYYQLTNLDNRVSNPDQLLTQDVDKFCQSVTDLYSNVAKPVLDIAIYTRTLSSGIGMQGPANMLGYLVLSGLVLTRLRRPTGLFTVQEQALEGEFRYVNSRLITHSEEIAFYNGRDKERGTVLLTLNRLVNHIRSGMQFRGLIGLVDNVVAKYLATVVGFLVMSRGFLYGKPVIHTGAEQSEAMEQYYRAGRQLVNLAKAMGRLVLAGRDLSRLAGFTSRVTDLQKVLHDLNNGRFVRTQSKGTGRDGDADADATENAPLAPNSGTVVLQDNVIELQNVPLVTPNGDPLVRSLSFRVESGMNVLVCGPNGCGKSSLFRVIGGLWPLFGGTMIKPPVDSLFYVPQRPYLPLGTLRDQIIYPHTKEEFYASGYTDADLAGFLDDVSLGYLEAREGGWDTIADWSDVLSGGEKQRIAMARLFYNRPTFAILDECTSAVSVDVEGAIYRACREQNITLFTVSHRASLWKYHDYVLKFDGRGAYEFTPIDGMDPNAHGS